MSDVEEPAAKISKRDDIPAGEEMDNGQEEWLSEEILTDDDYNPVADQDQSDSTANTSQEEGNADSMDQVSQDTTNTAGENIERTLNNLENATPSSQQAELPEELGAFLIRKTDRRVVEDQAVTKEPEPESELDESTKQSEDDGNDTDDLLRMLGEDNSKNKEVPAAQRAPQSVQRKDSAPSSDEDDDEYIFEDSKVSRIRVPKDMRNKENNGKKLMLSKGVFIHKRTASRAVPEDTSDREADNDHSSKVTVSKFKTIKLDGKDVRSRTASKAVPEDLSDQDSVPSSDEATTVKRIFDVHHKKMVTAGPRALTARRRDINAVKTVTKRVISINPKSGPGVTLSSPSKPKIIAKPPAKTPVMLQVKPKPPASFTETRTVRAKTSSRNDVDDEENFNDDLHGMDSEVDQEGGQRLMRPERMDEEVPSDAESRSEDDSYYDEMPSSESDDADDWFTLDIRAERAAEYIPMLGEDAKALLSAEEQRAAARLGALRRSAGALVEGRRSLATQLRLARSLLAQLDAALAQ